MRSLFFAAALVAFAPLFAGAQSLDSASTNPSPFTVSIDPQYPAPNSPVFLTFLSTSLDLANATIVVTVQGKELYRGNARAVPISLGRAGTVTPVVVRVVTNGSTYTQTLSLQPQDVSLVVEPLSSSPPLYPGKPWVPLEGSARIVAVANLKNAAGTPIAPSSCSYTWMVDGATIDSSSGIGKNTLVVASPLQYRSRTVSVTTMTQDGSLLGGASITLTGLPPTLRIYESDPLLGLRYERAISDQLSISGTEEALYAAPFSLPTHDGAPFVRWFLNGSQVQTGNLITLRPSGTGQGTASLSVVASASDTSLVSSVVSLFFGSKASTNLFGL